MPTLSLPRAAAAAAAHHAPARRAGVRATGAAPPPTPAASAASAPSTTEATLPAVRVRAAREGETPSERTGAYAARSASTATKLDLTPRTTSLLAAWDEPGTGDDRHRLGLIDVDAERGRTTVRASIAVSTRAHGLAWEAERGTVLAVARRPGDWMLRWRPGAARSVQSAQWLWSPPQRRFNGHACTSAIACSPQRPASTPVSRVARASS